MSQASVPTPSASPEKTYDYNIWQVIIANLPAGWRFDTVDGLVLDETTGTAFLATQVHLSYFNNESLEES